MLCFMVSNKNLDLMNDFPTADKIIEDLFSEPHTSELEIKKKKAAMIRRLEHQGLFHLEFNSLNIMVAKELKILGYIIDLTKDGINIKLL